MAAGEIERFAAPDQPHYHDVAVHYFIQFHLHRQLLAAATYAREHGIVLKGDIPIGVYRHSVDTWVAPELFHMDRQAGAPPDDFSASGQNWRFPTYNWEAMANDGFAWWRARLRKMSAYFDAFRIDHILGFFRIWEIPQNQVEGLLGSFSPSLPMSRGEIESWIGWFDQDRLCRPYIRPGMLESRFGAFAADALRECLEEGGPGILRLRPGFESQREVEARFPDDPALPAEQKARHAAMRAGLFSLIAEVLFLEGPGGGGQTFHPRHSLHRTQSYADLDGSTKSRLNDLYVHYYYRRHEQFWREQALARLPAVKNATDMLICGEDLGMVPDCVAGVMREMEVLSLFIQRMPKDPRQEFHHPGHSPYWSVCATGSHDMSTLRAWWEEDRERSARFFRQVLGRQDTPPYFAEPWLCTEIVAQHLRSPCMWAVFPLQDLLGMDASTRCQDPRTERINVPSEPRHYWRYRMHLSLEDLRAAKPLADALRGMVREAGRDA
jgi:4-alpha-glucanotransferase